MNTTAASRWRALELYRSLRFIEEVLLSNAYEFINLSLGPALPVEDDVEFIPLPDVPSTPEPAPAVKPEPTHPV